MQRLFLLMTLLCCKFNLVIAAPIQQQLRQIANTASAEYALRTLQISVKYNEESMISFCAGSDPCNEKMLFPMGSIAKPIVAQAIIRLISQHRLSYNDKLERFLPEYPLWRRVTIRELLNQASGIADYSNGQWFFEQTKTKKNWNASQLLGLAYNNQKNNINSGNSWHYSNTNYVILGVIIEELVGGKLAKVLPLLLPDLSRQIKYDIDDFTPTLLGRYLNGNGVKLSNLSSLQGSGAVLATPGAIAEWYWNLFNHSAPQQISLIGLVNILNPRISYTPADFGYDLGIFAMPSPDGVILFTPGMIPGATSMVAYFPCYNLAVEYTAIIDQPVRHGFHLYMLKSILGTITKQLPAIRGIPKTKHSFCNGGAKINQYAFPRF